MPIPQNTHCAQIERSFTRALPRAGMDFTFNDQPIRGILEAAPAIKDGVDRNPHDNTAGIIRVLRSAFTDVNQPLPRQGDALTDADGAIYRVAGIEHTPGLPVVGLILGNITPAA